MNDERLLSAEELDTKPIDTVIYAGPILRYAQMYKRVRDGWKRFHPESFRAFGLPLTSAALAKLGAHP